MARVDLGLIAMALFGGLFVACSGDGGTSVADAGASVDQAVLSDLATELDVQSADASPMDSGDNGRDVAIFDASFDGGSDADASADRPDAPTPWGDAPLVDLGGIVLPVDPHAVPAPGSECTSVGGVREGDPTIAPPRPVRPLSVSRVTSQRPTFQWVLPEGTTGARVEMCADRCCTRVLQTLDAEGTTVRPTTTLPPGVVFWRMFGRRGTAVGSRASYTWEFGVRRRDAPHDTSWGTLRDFNGDGYDDLMVFQTQRPMENPSDLLLLAGSAEGLRAPLLTGVVTGDLPTRGAVGDFNGDGLADLTWDEGYFPGPSWFEVVRGSSVSLRSSVHASTRMMGSCAVTTGGVAVDWNGDGYSDLLVGIRFGCDEPVFSGIEASILAGYLGSPAGIADIAQWAMRVDGRFSHPSVRFSGGLGDLDGDGYGDVMATSAHNGIGTTSVPAEQIVFHGTATGEPRFERIPQPVPVRSGWEWGRSASIGDVDGDGYVDFLISLNFSQPVYVYRHVTGLSVPNAVLSDPLRGSYFGSYFGAGDVNGDGLADVIVSSELASSARMDGLPINQGRTYVYPGSAEGVASVPLVLERANPHMEVVMRQSFGGHSMSPGDVNGDGIDDVTMTDTLGRLLCIRLGRLDFGNGSPDACLNGVDSGSSWSY
jgi:hypothetical protein